MGANNYDGPAKRLTRVAPLDRLLTPIGHVGPYVEISRPRCVRHDCDELAEYKIHVGLDLEVCGGCLLELAANICRGNR